VLDKRHTTSGLAIGWLTCKLSAVVLLSSFVPANELFSTFFTLLYFWLLIKLLFSADSALFPAHRQALSVGCY
jgi:hypothetical protein